MIPEDYVSDLQLRLGLYRRLATLETDAEIDAFGAELIDRFGPLPTEVEQLLKIMAIKVLCRRANVEKVDGGPEGHHRRLPRQRLREPDGLVAYVAEQGSFAKVRPDMRVVFVRDVETPEERIKVATGILRDLVRIAEGKQVPRLGDRLPRRQPRAASRPPRPLQLRLREGLRPEMSLQAARHSRPAGRTWRGRRG